MIAFTVTVLVILFIVCTISMDRFYSKKTAKTIEKLEKEGRCVNMDTFIDHLKKTELPDKTIVETLETGVSTFYMIERQDNGRYDIDRIGTSGIAANLPRETVNKLFKQWRERLAKCKK